MATYTPSQISQYLQHININLHHTPSSESLTPSLPLLTSLIQHQQATIPFDSLALHYSPTRHIALDPAALFAKLVARGRGGYCMEVNSLFGTILRSLGFSLYTVGARVNQGRGFRCWDHQLNIVTVDGKRYLVDVGFGSNTPVVPVLLKDGVEVDNLAPAQGRLLFRRVAEHTDPHQRLWVYSTRPAKGREWTDRYAFAETEWFAADFAGVNMAVSTAPQSFFVQTVTVVRLVLDGEGKVEGQWILHKDYVKRRRAGQEVGEIEKRLRSEEQRVDALRRYFGIELTSEERGAIRGLQSEITGRGEPEGELDMMHV